MQTYTVELKNGETVEVQADGYAPGNENSPDFVNFWKTDDNGITQTNCASFRSDEVVSVQMKS